MVSEQNGIGKFAQPLTPIPGRSAQRAWKVQVAEPGVDSIPLPLTFTPEAVTTLVNTVGALPPETGAKLFGPTEFFGIDLVEFDTPGSQNAGSAIYSPDTAWGEQRVSHWLHQPGSEQRIWTGDAHSHPSGIGRPSRKVEYAQGDLGYVEAVFETNEIQNEFVIPILTNTGSTGVVSINPWVVNRSEPTTPLWADFIVAPVSQFPIREFNPAFMSGSSGTLVNDLTLDLDKVITMTDQHQSISNVRYAQNVIILESDDYVVEVTLSAEYIPCMATISNDDGLLAKVGVCTSGESAVEKEAAVAQFINLAFDECGDGLSRPRHQFTPAVPIIRHESVIGSAADLNEISCHVDSSNIDVSAYYARTEGLISEQFHEKSVLVVGASGGSYLIEKLARLGPAKLVIIDFDIVEIQNLVRTTFSLDDLNRFKVDALAERIAKLNPFVEVDPVVDDVLKMSSSRLKELVLDSDLVIAGTDSFEAQALMNEVSLAASRPAIFIDVHEGAHGGLVRWQIPGETACYRCMAQKRFSAFDERGAEVDLDGAAGLLVDVQTIDMVAATIAVALLERGRDTAKGRLIDELGDRTEIVISNGPSYEFGRALFAALDSDGTNNSDPERSLATYLGMFPTITLPWKPDPLCPACRHREHFPANIRYIDDPIEFPSDFIV